MGCLKMIRPSVLLILSFSLTALMAVTPTISGSSIVVDAPKGILTNVPFRSEGYRFFVKICDINTRATYDCSVDPSFVGYAKPWMDHTGKSFCIFFPYPPEKLVFTTPKLKGMKGAISVSINATMKENSHVSGSASALFIGGFSILPRRIYLSDERNKTILTILGNTNVEIGWRRRKVLMISRILHDDFGVGGRAEYEVEALGNVLFEDTIVFTLKLIDQSEEVDVHYEPYMLVFDIRFWIYSLVTMMVAAMLVNCFCFPSYKKEPVVPMQDGGAVQDGCDVQGCDTRQQQYVRYLKETIDGSPYRRRNM